MQGNRLILILVGVVVLMVGVFAYIASNDPALQDQSTAEGEGTSFFDFGLSGAKPVTIDADGATETLENIARDSADIKSRFRGVEEENAEANRRFSQNEALIKQLTDQNKLLSDQVKQQTAALTAIQLEPKGVDVDTIRSGIVEELKTELQGFLPKPNEGLVIEEEEPVIDEGTTRVRSLNVPLDKRGALSADYVASLRAAKSPPNLNSSASKLSPLASGKEEVVIDPRYTIFADSILNDALTLTVLNGRVPKKGDLNDPSPFKVIIGNENLAANGFKIPNLKGMMMSGIAYGDKVLKCVRTKIQRATYIFEDGRGITFPIKTGSKVVLGYLTDPYGNPCIKGQFFTDKQQRLRQTFLAGLATGAASAYASSETSSTTNSDGDTTLNVTGDKLKFLAGTGIAQGTEKVVKQLEKEEFDIWETVVVPSGVRVAVHLEQTLALDQTSLQRKVVYVGTNNTQSFTD